MKPKNDLIIFNRKKCLEYTKYKTDKAVYKGSLANLTLISSKFLIPYRGFGMLAVIGPVNLDYQRVVSQLNVVNRVLTMKLTDFYRYLSMFALVHIQIVQLIIILIGD